MVVRGRPEHGAWLYDNCLACASEEACWEQLHFEGNVHVDQSPDNNAPAPNKYNQVGDFKSLFSISLFGTIPRAQKTARPSAGATTPGPRIPSTTWPRPLISSRTCSSPTLTGTAGPTWSAATAPLGSSRAAA